LIDLAAPRMVGLEEVGPGHFVVRTRRLPQDAGLSGYESQVLHLVETRRDERIGAGPSPATDRGPGRPVVVPLLGCGARRCPGRGLVASGWSRGDWAVLATGLAVALGLTALAFEECAVGADEQVARVDGLADRVGEHEVAIFPCFAERESFFRGRGPTCSSTRARGRLTAKMTAKKMEDSSER
jgi:hypothetical protein